MSPETIDRYAKIDGRLLGFLFLAALGLAISVLFLGLQQPLLDLHSFRQTQTALTVYWLVHGGAWLAYETPALGFPWAIPFEFPLYQWIVAALHQFGPLSIEANGRLLSFLLLVGCLWPAHLLYRDLGLNRDEYLIFGILFLLAPLHLFWGRTVMIESMAVFLSLLYVAFLQRYLLTGNAGLLVLSAVTAALAAAVKITTFLGFALAAGCLIAWHAKREGAWRRPSVLVRRHLPAMLTLVIAFIALKAWTDFADSLKVLNPWGALLTSDALKGWNFGTWAQRWSSDLWRGAILGRAIPDIAGSSAVAASVVVAAFAVSRRRWIAAAVAGLLFLLPFLVFTNLHIVHNYYQVGNSLFLIALLALLLGDLWRNGPRWLSLALLLILAGTQLTHYFKQFHPLVVTPPDWYRTINVANYVRSTTPPDTAIVVFGFESSPELAFYAKRKSLNVATWTPEDLFRSVIQAPALWVAPVPLSAVIDCEGKDKPWDTARRSALDHMVQEASLQGRAIASVQNGCLVIHFLALDQAKS